MTILTQKPTLYLISRKNEKLEKYGENFRIICGETGEVKKKFQLWQFEIL